MYHLFFTCLKGNTTFGLLSPEQTYPLGSFRNHKKAKQSTIQTDHTQMLNRQIGL